MYTLLAPKLMGRGKCQDARMQVRRLHPWRIGCLRARTDPAPAIASGCPRPISRHQLRPTTRDPSRISIPSRLCTCVKPTALLPRHASLLPRLVALLPSPRRHPSHALSQPCPFPVLTSRLFCNIRLTIATYAVYIEIYLYSHYNI